MTNSQTYFGKCSWQLVKHILEIAENKNCNELKAVLAYFLIAILYTLKIAFL